MDERTTLEIIAPSVDEGIQKGLDQLGLPREAVQVEVLDPGSRGLFGLGGRQARIRLTFGGAPKPETVNVKADTLPVPPEEQPEIISAKAADSKAVESGSDEEALNVAMTIVRDLLERMHVRATVVSQIVPPEDTKDTASLLVEIKGDDLSILIGRHSETLNALQYVTNLIVGKELGRWIPLVIDVQGYRDRRERQLRQMAHRMADQVVQSGRKLTLEPMPANERRVIHLELREHSEVSTESVGEEPNRKVTIFLKK
jgi:spoIIIJ-associated protein